MKPALSFSSGQICGYASDCPDKLARTILIVMANCDFVGPKFVASMTPIYHLESALQRKVVLDVVNKISEAGIRVFCCTFDGNSVNSKMVATLPGLDPEFPML